MRDRTERPEVVEAGCARLVGVGTENILATASDLFEIEQSYYAMAHLKNPSGDGWAADRIVDLRYIERSSAAISTQMRSNGLSI
jgi:UDP-N-acetylglucosamine 2-epimerase (non-hydrolysing)